MWALFDFYTVLCQAWAIRKKLMTKNYFKRSSMKNHANSRLGQLGGQYGRRSQITQQKRGLVKGTQRSVRNRPVGLKSRWSVSLALTEIDHRMSEWEEKSQKKEATERETTEDTLTKAKLWERYGNFWAICDPYVALIWDGQMVVWHWYGVIFLLISTVWKIHGLEGLH